MGFFQRFRAKGKVARQARGIDVATLAHLNGFVASRRGVEVWVERPTSMSPASILLVAHDGEWTRRSVPSVEFGHSFAIEHALPSYDAGVMPYPQRMRDHDARRRPPKPEPPLA